MTNRVKIRELEEADLPEVLELLRVSLGETAVLRRTRNLFAWKHWENPFGRSIALVAIASDQIVGLRTFMRWRLATGDAQIECVRPVDTATHPDFQRQGIFRRLTMHALEVASDLGIHLVFNTPNEKSRPGYLSMGWSEVGHLPIQAFIRPIRWFSSRAEPNGLGMAGPPDLRALQPRHRLGLHTPQSPRYLEWRYHSHPTVRYSGYSAGESTAVARVDRRIGRTGMAISDVYGEHPAQAIRRTRRLASDASYLVTSFSRKSSERRAALMSGLVTLPGVHPLTLVAMPLVDFGIDALSLSNWELSLSDLELL